MTKEFEEGKQLVRIDNFGVLLNKLDKLIEKLDKLTRSLYFMEDRQKELLELVKQKL